MKARIGSVVSDAEQVQLAIALARAGARLQVLETETKLSRERLLRLYKEVVGVSPPKGMLPFSTDWFVTWMPNIHASMFMNIHAYLTANTKVKGIRAVLAAYKLYSEHVKIHDLEQVLSFTRAWSLVRFVEAKLLGTAPCTVCGGRYVLHARDPQKDYVCGLCNVPSRAGKTRKHAIPRLAGAVAIPKPVIAEYRDKFLLQSLMPATASRRKNAVTE